MGDQFKYRAFLSYSHQDKKWADWLHRELERYRVPPRLRSASANRLLPRHLRPVFRDREELPSAASLPDVIDRALAESESLIVICSPAAAKSSWVDNEIRRFRELGRGDRILCLIVDGEPIPGDPSDCFPPSLRRSRANGAAGEPIAADVRGGRSARHHAKIMIIAGLLGVGLDELLQRDLHRRYRNLFALAAGSILLAVVMAGLTVFAFMAKTESERRRADAENLVGFMLGDLREDLHSIGRLDIYTTVADQAMDYFQSLEERDARDEVLAQRALALRQIGSSRLDLGNPLGAMEAFGEALQINLAIAGRNSDRPDWQLALAESHFSVGEVHWQLGHYDAARAKFLDQLAVVEALAEANPGDPQLLTHSGYAWTNFGRILERDGQLEDARVAYDKVMEIFQRLLDLQPESVDAILELGFAHNNLGKLKVSLGDLEEAEAHMREDLAIKREILDDEPGNSLWREYVASAEYWLSRVLLLSGDFTETRRLGRNAIDRLDALLLTDSEQTRWRHRRADASRVLATACRLQAEPDCAARYRDASLADLEALIAINSRNVIWRRSKAQGLLEAAWQAAGDGEVATALDHAEGALAIALELTADSSEDRDTRKVEIMTQLTLGDLRELHAETEEGVSHWQSAQTQLDDWFAASADPEMLTVRALLLERQGRREEAQALRAPLELIGYHSPYPPSGGRRF